jgi:hypothetical protein
MTGRLRASDRRKKSHIRMTAIAQKSRHAPHHRSVAMILAAILLPLVLGGCVERRMTIRSNPPGALVYVDDNEIGTTPVSVNFTYYGTRKIRLVKDGFETLTVMQSFSPPWYQYVPLDFISENFVPGKITDRRVLDYQLQAQMLVPGDQLRARGEDLRRTAGGSGVVPLAPPLNVVPQPQPIVPQGNVPMVAPPLYSPPPAAPETLPTPAGIGGQSVHPLP